MEFDLQLFADETESESAPENQPETSPEEQPPIPDELGGLPEEYARETMAEWEQMQTADEPETPDETPAPVEEPQEPPITREQYQAAINELNQLKAQIAATQQRPQQQPQIQTPQQQPPMFTPEVSKQINDAITAEAMALSGMTAADVASLEYADDDDPRIAQWNQAKYFAQSKVYSEIQLSQIQRQQQAREFYANHAAAIQTYNEFAQKQFAEPDFQAVQNFATNEFFEQLPPDEQRIVANSYVRIERQTASPAEMMVVKNYFERAQAAYRSRGAKTKNQSPAPKLPRSDQLKGTSTTSDGQLSATDVEKLLAQDFTTLTPQQQKTLLGLTG